MGMTLLGYNAGLDPSGVNVVKSIETYLGGKYANTLINDSDSVMYGNALQTITLPYWAYSAGIDYIKSYGTYEDPQGSTIYAPTFYYFAAPIHVTPKSVTYQLTVDAWHTFISNNANAITLKSGTLVRGHTFATETPLTCDFPDAEIDGAANHVQILNTFTSVRFVVGLQYHDVNDPDNVINGIMVSLNSYANLATFAGAVATFVEGLHLFKIAGTADDYSADTITGIYIVPSTFNPGGQQVAAGGNVIGTLLSYQTGSFTTAWTITNNDWSKDVYFGNGKNAIKLEHSNTAQPLRLTVSYLTFAARVGISVAYNGKDYDMTDTLGLGEINVAFTERSTFDKISNVLQAISCGGSVAAGVGALASGNPMGILGLSNAVGQGANLAQNVKQQTSERVAMNVTNYLSMWILPTPQANDIKGFAIWKQQPLNHVEKSYYLGENGLAGQEYQYSVELIGATSTHNKTYFRFLDPVLNRVGVAQGELLGMIEERLKAGIRIWSPGVYLSGGPRV